MTAFFHKFPQSSPDDLSSLQAAFSRRDIIPSEIVALLGKTEGNGCVNDFTRGFANSTLRHCLSQWLPPETIAKIPMIMSGGSEGVMTPHLNVFTEKEHHASQTKGLIVARSHTRDFSPAEIGTHQMVEVVADSIRKMLQDKFIHPSDTHFVQIKCPLLSSHDIAKAKEPLATTDTLKSMSLSRGAAALGVALALDELPRERVFQSKIGDDLSLFSSVASISAGIELRCCEIILLANSEDSNSPYRIGHDVMVHNLDTQAILRAAEKSQSGHKQYDPSRVVQIFAKAEADPSGYLLGQRHTMLQDSDISPTRMSRAVVAAVAASIVQDTMVYVSGGAEHQGPPGGGTVAVLSRIT